MLLQKDHTQNSFKQIGILRSLGDEMGMIPDGSVDVVVVTLVLCSVNSIDKVLREILRVLTPVS